MESANKTIVEIAAKTPGFYVIGPFMTTSGCLAPIYIDIRKVFTNPQSLQKIAEEIVKFIKKKKIKFDIIIGGATAGIPIATAVALQINKPLGYVRKQAKPGGLGRAVEGNWQPNMKAILIDDAAAHGASKTQFIKNIRKTGMMIDTVIVVYARNRSSKSDRAWIKKSKVKLYDFGDIANILDSSYKTGCITKEAHQLLTWYSADPHKWNQNKDKWKYFQSYKRKRKRDSLFGI